MKIVILYSGGLDSLIMQRFAEVYYKDAEVKLVYYDIGHEYAHKEIASLPDNVDIRKIEWMNNKTEAVGKEGSSSGNIIIPGRNMLLAINAACMYMPDEIWMGALAGETHAGSTDKNFEFLEKINDTIKYVMSPFDKQAVVRFPFAEKEWNKKEVTKWYLNNGGTLEDISNSSSCLSGEHGNCGQCVVCFRRFCLLYDLLGVEEDCNLHPIHSISKNNLDMVMEMIQGEDNKYSICHYDDYRINEILPGLRKYFSVANNKDLEDKLIKEVKTKVLVVGGGSGIGKAAVDALVSEGAEVHNLSTSTGWDMNIAGAEDSVLHEFVSGEYNVLVNNYYPTQIKVLDKFVDTCKNDPSKMIINVGSIKDRSTSNTFPTFDHVRYHLDKAHLLLAAEAYSNCDDVMCKVSTLRVPLTGTERNLVARNVGRKMLSVYAVGNRIKEIAFSVHRKYPFVGGCEVSVRENRFVMEDVDIVN